MSMKFINAIYQTEEENMKLKAGCLGMCMVLVALFAFGCSGVSTIGYPAGEGKYRVMRTVTDQSAFATTQQRSWLEMCESKDGKAFENCKGEGDLQFTASSGYATGLGSSAMQSAAILGGAALIGNGLKHSGSTNTTTTNQSGGNATQAQGQGQIQGQLQGQIQGQGQAQLGY